MKLPGWGRKKAWFFPSLCHGKAKEGWMGGNVMTPPHWDTCPTVPKEGKKIFKCAVLVFNISTICLAVCLECLC